MRIAFSSLITVHALIHVMGFAKAFGLASLAQLKIPVSRPMGVLWLAAAVLILAAVALLFVAPRWFWLVGVAGLVVSQIAIIALWHDARFGTIANIVLLAAVIYGAFAWGPFGLRAEYERLVRDGISRMASSARPPNITEADLAALPPLVQRYLRFAGVVGTPKVQGFRARMTGRIRGSATAPWMPFVAEQYNFYDPPRRYFWMEATRGGLPVDGLHAYGETDASMRIRLLSIVPVVRRRRTGDDARRDGHHPQRHVHLCPGEPARPVDSLARARRAQRGGDVQQRPAHRPRRSWSSTTLALSSTSGRTIARRSPRTARPCCRSAGRRRSATTGRMGPYRLAARGEARYAAPTGEYAYIELEVNEVSTEVVSYNGGQQMNTSRETHALFESLVADATMAASSHNTQPWRFEIGEDRIRILPDFARRCSVVDPDDHHLYASLGCAAENMVVAAAAKGWEAVVEVRSSGNAHAVEVMLNPGTPVASPPGGRHRQEAVHPGGVSRGARCPRTSWR